MRVNRSFVLLEANQSVAEGLEFVKMNQGTHFVILRREDGSLVYWYSYRVWEFIQTLESCEPSLTLQKALDLHEDTSKPIHQEGSASFETNVAGAIVFNPRGRVIGVLERVDLAGPPIISVEDIPLPDTPKIDLSGGEFGYPNMEVHEDLNFEALQTEDTGFIHIDPDPGMKKVAQGEVLHLSREDGWSIGGGGKARSIQKMSAGEPLSEPIPAPSATVPQKPFSAWPNLEAPESVSEEDEFTLTVGFAHAKVENVRGGPVELIDAPEKFELNIHLVGVGFDAPSGWVRNLLVVRDTPYDNSVEFKLVAKRAEIPIETRTLAVQFFYKSNLCGQAQRNITVTARGVSALDHDTENTSKSSGKSGPVRVISDIRSPDLTVTVTLRTGRGQREAFDWVFESPHPIELPETSSGIELDQQVGAFVDELSKSLVRQANNSFGDNEMRGVGRKIARRIPPAFWIALKSVAKAIAHENRAPDVQFITEETRLPWELAWMKEPLDPTRPNHLGAQVNFGRWIMGAEAPQLPPEHRLIWSHTVVVIGNYPKDSGLELPDAVREAQTIQAQEPQCTTPIELTSKDLDPFLEGVAPPNGCEIVHFACHGSSSLGNTAISTLAMQDGCLFTPTTLEGSQVGEKWRPFLFLNACEVGKAGVALGELSGFVGAALYQNFRGFVGPLWEVDSKVAYMVAEEFYQRTRGKGESVASVLRDIRSNYKYLGANQTPQADTYLAYVFYGHPALRFERKT